MAVLLAAVEDTADENTWGYHLLDLQDRGVLFSSFITDQGTGLKAGLEASGIGTPQQLDEFHTLKYARDIAHKLERRAETAAAAYLSKEMARSLSPLHNDGTRRTVTEAQEDLGVLSELWRTIPDENIRKLGQSLLQRIPGLTNFLSFLEDALRPWEINNTDAVSFVGWVWINCGALGEKPPATDEAVREQWGIDLPTEGVRAIWDALEYLHPTSSHVECLNSILRRRAHAHGGLTADLLTLVIFRHNMRRFHRWKRAGKSPFEILAGGPVLSHWTDGLFDSRHPLTPEVKEETEALWTKIEA